ncbi:hypothetical protein PVAP13_7KG415340 [Panicum virgatum]|uniref:Uncharacterized protein n=1 Tax=Panicum virgatum TaxID=38727 RepID=A0A8T0QQE0_PANVG|nr:hypothetical protein PVAP13_7KG415340 [Panicum virgatum]
MISGAESFLPFGEGIYFFFYLTLPGHSFTAPPPTLVSHPPSVAAPQTPPAATPPPPTAPTPLASPPWYRRRRDPAPAARTTRRTAGRRPFAARAAKAPLGADAGEGEASCRLLRPPPRYRALPYFFSK